MVVINPNKIGLKFLITWGLLWTTTHCCLTPDIQNVKGLSRLDRQLLRYVNRTLSVDRYNIFAGVSIERKDDVHSEELCDLRSTRKLGSVEQYIKRRIEDYAKTHVVAINMPDTGRFFGCK